MVKLSKTILSIKPSPTIKISQMAKKLKNDGINIISFGIGETDFRTPVDVDDNAINAIRNGENKYPPVTGYAQLKQCIIDKFERDNNLIYSQEEIIVCNGAKQALYNLFSVTINPGDEIIIPCPYWVSYVDMVKLAGGKPIFVECKISNNFKLDTTDLKKAITKKTKWIVFNSPNNPTGACYSYSEIKKITDLLLHFPNIYLVSDDIYEHIIYDDVKFYTPAAVEAKLHERIVTINGLSKAYSMTGWRVGYAAGDREIINAMSILQGQSTSGVCCIAQHAAIAAFHCDQNILNSRTQQLKKRRDIAIQELSKIPELLTITIPQGAFYLFVSCTNILNKKTPKGMLIENCNDLAQYFLEEYQIVVIPGSAFGMENFFRLSYAIDEQSVQLGCKKIVQACEKISY